MRFFLLAGWIAVCPALAQAEAPADRAATVHYLEALQAPDGGFLPARPEPSRSGANDSTVGATAAALRALKQCGARPRDARACARFVQSCYDRAMGGFAPRPGGRPDAIATATGIMAFAELELPLDDDRAKVVAYLERQARTAEEVRMAAAGLETLGQRPKEDAWIEQVVRTRRPDGTFGQGDGAARETASAVVTLLRLGGPVEHREKISALLKAGQRRDGGYGRQGAATSDLESCYRVLRALVMLKEKPADAPACRRFVDRCRNADGGYGLSPGQSSTVPATYFAMMVLHWLDESS